MSGWYLARRVGETCAAAKVLVGKDRPIVGAHLLGPECEQIINFFGIAIRNGWTVEELAGIVSAYPSAASYVGHLV
jgi:glutathione reductase (NADPH)